MSACQGMGRGGGGHNLEDNGLPDTAVKELLVHKVHVPSTLQ